MLGHLPGAGELLADLVFEDFDFHGELDAGAVGLLGGDADEAVELLDDEFADHEAEAAPVDVVFVLVAADAERFEEVGDVVLVDADAGVTDFDFEEALGLVEFCDDGDAAL